MVCFYTGSCVILQAPRKLTSVEDLLSLHGLSQYAAKLVENGYDDIRFISDITDSELNEIGVVSPSERMRVSHTHLIRVRFTFFFLFFAVIEDFFGLRIVAFFTFLPQTELLCVL